MDSAPFGVFLCARKPIKKHISEHKKWFNGNIGYTGEYINIDGEKYPDRIFFAGFLGFLPSFGLAALFTARTFNRDTLLDPIAKIFVATTIFMASLVVFLCKKYRETIRMSLGEKAREITRELLRWYKIPFKQLNADQMGSITLKVLKVAATQKNWDVSVAIAEVKEKSAVDYFNNSAWRELVEKACATHDKWFNGVIDNKTIAINIYREAILNLLRALPWMFAMLLASDVVFPMSQKDALQAAVMLVVGAIVFAPVILFKIRPRRTER